MTTAYRINIALNLISNSSTATRGIIRELTLVETVGLRLKGVLGGLVVGAGLVAGIKAASRATSDYADEVQKLQAILRTPANMAAADAEARRVSMAVPTTNYTDNLKAIGDLVPAFGNVPDAIKNIESLQKLSSVITAFGGKPDQAFDIAKALETRGAANSPSQFRRESGEMVQAIESTNGRVDANQFLLAIRQSNPFATGFSEQFLYRILPTLMQDMGGSRAGTALNSFENTLVGGRMTKAAKGLFQQFGLLDANAKFNEGSAGTVQLKGARVEGSGLALSDPDRWINEVLAPAMVAHGFVTPKQQEEVIAKLFSNRNSERIAVEFDVNRNRYAKDSRVIGGTENPFDTYGRLKDNDPKVLHQELLKQFDDVMINLGNVALPLVIPAMRDLVKLLQLASDVIEKGFGPLGAFHDVGSKIKVDTDTGPSYGDKWRNALHSLEFWKKDSNAVPPPNKQANNGTMTGTVVLNNRVVGQFTAVQNKQMSLPNNSGSSPDPRMSYVPNN